MGLDEWRTLFVVLNGSEGLEIYADQVAHRRNAAMRIITTQQIRRATRSTGLEFFEWGIQVHMVDDEQEMLEVRRRAPPPKASPTFLLVHKGCPCSRPTLAPPPVQPWPAGACATSLTKSKRERASPVRP